VKGIHRWTHVKDTPLEKLRDALNATFSGQQCGVGGGYVE